MAVDKGTCSRDLIRYYYDPTVDECKRFSYSGCGGNANRFMRRTNCRSRCVKGTTHKPVPLGEPITRKSEVLTNHIESKVRRTLRTTTSTAAPTTITVRTMKSVRRTDVTKATANIRNCPHCDPLFGICVDGECGCIAGFRKLGKICIDINECDDKTTCPANSRCVNTMGSFRCDCDAGFTTDGKCAARREACEDRFDVRYTEEDCSGGDQELRFYFDHETGFCRQFFYGGCLGKSRNIFADAYTCESLCANGRKSILLDSSTPQMVAGVSTKMLDSSDVDNDHISVTPALDGGGSQLTGAIQDYSPPEFSISFESQDSEKCTKPFDGVLRLECIDASWVERFYWDDSKKNCEAFWYDSSCDPRDVVGKNFFGSMESCKDHCSTSRPATKPTIKSTTKSTIITRPNEQLVPKVQTKAEHSESDPFNLLSQARQSEAETTSLSPVEVPRVEPRQEVSNFEAKTPILPFDRKKYMEEFRKKLTALPSGYKKNTSSSTLSTIIPHSKHFEEQTSSFDGGFALTAPSPTKSTIGIFATSTFDKKKFAEEFRRKLMALPDGTSKKSILDLPKTFESRKTPFTLPPSIFFNASTTAVPVVASNREHTDMVRIEPEDLRTSLSGHPDVSESHSHTTTTPTTTAEDFVVETKKSIVETLEYISRPKDLCDEPLQPKLEEDCSNENWELKWFFNKEKGACKSFWYGGCDVEARNFFGDVKSCRKTCGHKYALPEEAFKPHYILTPSSMNLLAPTFSPAPLTSTYLEDVNLFPTRSELTLATATTAPTTAASETTTDFVRNVDAAPRTAPVQTTEEIKVLRSTTSVKTSPDQDVCNQGYDPKWDEDCDNDNWIIRAYFDPDRNGCKRIWWGGCVTENKNLYSTMAECQRACSHKMDTEAPHYGPQSSLREATSSPLATTSSHTSSTSTSATTLPTRGTRASVLNDAPEVSDPVFQADLALQLASVKRKHEGRADLAYSSLVNHPVTVSSECLEQFDTNLTASCNDGTEWKNRYFYDADLRVCRMYWNGGCFSTSKNDFPDQESCQWKCMGARSADAAKACLDFFDQTYKEDCRHGEFTTRYFFNHNLKKCETFYWGGCKSSSQNFFSSLGQCEQLCESPPRELTQACLEPFDDGYRKSCSPDGRFKQYYYFDLGTSTCRMFWFGNCRGTGQNIFPSLESCQWICDRHREERIPASCSDAFDDKYKESCRGGQWKEKVYFDHGTGKCTQFWWDGCTSTSQNIFSNMKTCEAHCENPGEWS
ncbi:hypothetical protein Q1695_003144 [Nippostrongylus brasiliensis]|nr:hypothetical protein Q1695_003144 [Nippostrongylus brasiliensis]